MTRAQFDAYAHEAGRHSEYDVVIVYDPEADPDIDDRPRVHFTLRDYKWDDVDSGVRHYLAWAPSPDGVGELYYLVGDWDTESGAHRPDVRGLGMEGLAQWESVLGVPVLDTLGLDILLA